VFVIQLGRCFSKLTSHQRWVWSGSCSCANGQDGCL